MRNYRRLIKSIRKQCWFCGVKANAKYVSDYMHEHSAFDEECPGDYYHDECLKKILCSYKREWDKTAWMAWNIASRIKEDKRRDASRARAMEDLCKAMEDWCKDIK